MRLLAPFLDPLWKAADGNERGTTGSTLTPSSLEVEYIYSSNLNGDGGRILFVCLFKQSYSPSCK